MPRTGSRTSFTGSRSRCFFANPIKRPGSFTAFVFRFSFLADFDLAGLLCQSLVVWISFLLLLSRYFNLQYANHVFTFSILGLGFPRIINNKLISPSYIIFRVSVFSTRKRAGGAGGQAGVPAGGCGRGQCSMHVCAYAERECEGRNEGNKGRGIVSSCLCSRSTS
jgi:hypothetical protein